MTSASSFSSGKSTSRMEGIIERAWEDYRLLSKASTQLKPTCDEILSMIGSLHMVDDHLQTNDLSSSSKKALRNVESWCHGSLSDLEAALTTARSKTGPDRFRSIVDKALDPTNKLPGFVENLRSDQHKKILGVLSQLNVEELQESTITEWSVLEVELEKLGLPKDVIEEEFFFISDWLKENLFEQVEEDEELPDYTGNGPKPGRESFLLEQVEENEELPDYTPGEGRKPIQEKVQDLESTTKNLAITEPIATSSTAEPPPYTFEEGSDQPLEDSEFAHFIHKAKDIDLQARKFRKQGNPELCPNPIAWLPKSAQPQYKHSKDIIPIMPPDSFSVMAYETAPRCIDEIERLRQLIRTTFEHKPDLLNGGVIQEAMQSLGVMSIAMSKFAMIQDQRSSIDNLSDLDVLDFEFSTAAVLDEHLHFPEREFDLAKKSYYHLLTYVMGFLQAMKKMFPGRTYISTSISFLDSSWEENNLGLRVAWVEKQLASWDDVEQAANYCRDWHRMRPSLRPLAQTALQMWHRSEMILSGSQHEKQTIELTILSASCLPKLSFKTTPWVKIVSYGPNKFGGAYRISELETGTVKGQNPVWNKSFLLELPYQAKMIDFEVYDRVAGLGRLLGKLRLPFSYIPGVEATFANRSLVYGYDEEVDFPLNILEGKGKEKEKPLLRLGLKWQGRMAKIEELGLPIRPPGKIFRQRILGIPDLSERRVGVPL